MFVRLCVRLSDCPVAHAFLPIFIIFPPKPGLDLRAPTLWVSPRCGFRLDGGLRDENHTLSAVSGHPQREIPLLHEVGGALLRTQFASPWGWTNPPHKAPLSWSLDLSRVSH